MSIEEKIREIMLSEEFPKSEKLDRLHALIPADVFKIDNLNSGTAAQLRQLNEGLAVANALQRLRHRTFAEQALKGGHETRQHTEIRATEK